MANTTTGERRERLMKTAARVIPAIVEMIIDSGEAPCEALVTRCLVEYQRECERFFAAYCDESELHNEVKDDVLRAVYRRIVEAA